MRSRFNQLPRRGTRNSLGLAAILLLQACSGSKAPQIRTLPSVPETIIDKSQSGSSNSGIRQRTEDPVLVDCDADPNASLVVFDDVGPGHEPPIGQKTIVGEGKPATKGSSFVVRQVAVTIYIGSGQYVVADYNHQDKTITLLDTTDPQKLPRGTRFVHRSLPVMTSMHWITPGSLIM